MGFVEWGVKYAYLEPWTQVVEAVHFKRKRVYKNRDILNGEECQNVEKLGHTYERERTEKMGHSLFCPRYILNIGLASTERLPLLGQ